MLGVEKGICEVSRLEPCAEFGLTRKRVRVFALIPARLKFVDPEIAQIGIEIKFETVTIDILRENIALESGHTMNTSLKCASLDKDQEKTVCELEQELNCYIVALKPETRHANLSPEQYGRLQKIEKELGMLLVAYEPEGQMRLAELSDEPLRRIRQMEEETGLILLAYERVQQGVAVKANEPPEDYEPTPLSAEQCQRLQAVEAKTGLIFIAYRPERV